MSFLEIKDIDVYYDDIQIIFGLSLKVDKGKIVSIVGSNGAGKSTTIKAISGLVPPRRGEIVLAGEVISQLESHEIVERGVIQIPEGRRLFPLMTVEENLLAGAYPKRSRHNIPANLERVYSLFPRLKERCRQLASTLSGGEQQMLAIGRGLMSNPEVLMLDEPSLGLAPILVQDILAAIQEINKGGTTVLLVEQDVQDALSISDYGYVLENGRLAMEGAGRDLLEDDHIKKAYLGI